MTTVERFARLARQEGTGLYVRLEGGSAHVWSKAPWLGGEPTGEVLSGYDDEGRGALQRLAPVEPRTIFCVGRNYRAHAKELGNEVPVEPMIFYKPVSSLLAPSGRIELPPPSISARVEHEAELVVVVGKPLRRASRSEAEAAVFALTLACDVTARDLQKKDGQWWRAKGMDTFCPVGPVLVRGLDPSALRVRCEVGGALRQDGATADMIFSVVDVLVHISQSVTMLPGDIVLTGTPEGVGPLVAGDELRISTVGIGSLEASVVAPRAAEEPALPQP
jgi:2-keto-4-pentenoate hydratase/2-oxohepta-3-ene-1,7-dioic acid hydratase in catechol pathway